MPTSAKTFDDGFEKFRAEQEAPWMRLRYEIGWDHLRRHLDGGPLRVLDAGGGNGLDALWLAAQGHSVTVVDYSREMLANGCAAAEANGVADRVTFVQGELSGLATLFPRPIFELVLCHNVLQYMDDAPALIAQLCALLLPGGLVSLICPNPASDVLRTAIRETDAAAALKQMDDPTGFTILFGVAFHAVPSKTMQDALEEAGCALVGEYGIRCVCDYIVDNQCKYNPKFFADLLRLELALSDRHPYYLVARFNHLIARTARQPLPK